MSSLLDLFATRGFGGTLRAKGSVTGPHDSLCDSYSFILKELDHLDLAVTPWIFTDNSKIYDLEVTPESFPVITSLNNFIPSRSSCLNGNRPVGILLARIELQILQARIYLGL